MSRGRDSFAQRLLRWYAQHGRHDLPWQHPRSAWRVWVSEIMLQQTQVATAIPYFERFLQHFPDVQALANAHEDAVLAQWSGLGYYARARNLHRAARQVVAQHTGAIPDDYQQLTALPGIGASTAAAICAQAFGQRHAILDANVKRVLARHAGVEGWPGSTANTRRLQQEADARLPPQRLADYTQAIMDLGAAICGSRKAHCEACPVSADCVACATDAVHRLPTPKPARPRPERHAFIILLQHPHDASRIWLDRRPPSGIWGGLWAPPIVESLDAAAASLNIGGNLQRTGTTLKHSFTHFTWYLQPVYATALSAETAIRDDSGGWHTMAAALQRGLPAPVRRLIAAHRSNEEQP